MKHINQLIGAFLAGIMLAIAGTMYLSISNQIAGALLYSVGLITICEFGLHLYTGRVGYVLVKERENWLHRLTYLTTVWLGNLAGTSLCGILMREIKPHLADKATEMCLSKLTQQPWETIFLGFLCGILMYIAVAVYLNHRSITRYLGILFCVPVFIIAGLEHSIANMVYFAMADQLSIFSLQSIGYLLLVTAGNTLGSVILPMAEKLRGCESA